MCIGETKNKDKDIKLYTIFIKESDDITSQWIEFKLNNKPIKTKMISFIIYDLNGTLLGINSQNNQIYKLNEKINKWEGPVNVSKYVNIKQILYDLDKKMIGVDDKNILWKKDNIYWETSKWTKLSNKEHNYVNYWT